MKLDKTKPHEVPKDPDKAAADRHAKRKAVGEALAFFLFMGLAAWHYESPATFNAAIAHLVGLMR